MGGGGGIGDALNKAVSWSTGGLSDVANNKDAQGALAQGGNFIAKGGLAGLALGAMDPTISFNAQGVPIQMPTTTQMAQDQYGNVTSGLQQQQNFVNALNQQNGLGNQGQAFQMAQNQALGQGPNPAQAMLANQTGANVANQAALMAGQRGSGANVGMMARQAAQQGSNIQQGSIGQAAALQAQQQLAGQQQMANIANQQVAQQAQGIAQYGNQAANAYGQVSGNIQGQNAAQIGQQQGLNQINASMAAANQGAKNQMMGNIMGAVGSVGGMMAGGPMGAAVGGSMGKSIGGGGMGGAPAAGGGGGHMMYAMAEGGVIPQYKDGGIIDSIVNTVKGAFTEQPKGPVKPAPTPRPENIKKYGFDKTFAEGGNVNGPKSKVGQHFHGTLQPMLAQGGKVPALVSPGEEYLSPNKVEAVKQGANPLAIGEKIPGKAKVSGAKNSYANDTVPKTLESGGIVLPRSVTQAKNAPEKAAAFVAAILKKQALKKDK